MTNLELVEKAKWVATLNTTYCQGGIGQPAWESNKQDLMQRYPYNASKPSVVNATPNTFFFDCVCSIKSILWGFSGDTSQIYGGAQYASNGVPDIGETAMYEACYDKSTDFSELVPGEFLYMAPGHCGLYLGDGLCFETTEAYMDGSQVTYVENMGTKAGFFGHYWTAHGKLPYVDYVIEPTKEWHKGDLVVLPQGSHIWGTMNYFASWVYDTKLEVFEEPYRDRVVLSHRDVIIGPAYANDLMPYLDPEDIPEVPDDADEPIETDPVDTPEPPKGNIFMRVLLAFLEFLTKLWNYRDNK